jgi:hypothetical protein
MAHLQTHVDAPDVERLQRQLGAGWLADGVTERGCVKYREPPACAGGSGRRRAKVRNGWKCTSICVRMVFKRGDMVPVLRH